MKSTRAMFPRRIGVWIGLSILLLPPSLPLKADTYAGYGPESPGQYPSTNPLARPYHVEYRSNLDGFTNLFTLSFPRDFDPRKTYPVWFKFKPYYGSGMNIKQPNFAYNFCDAHQVIFIGCNDRDVGDAFFGDNTNVNQVTAQNLVADTIEVMNQVLYLFKINYVASFGASMGGYSALRLMTYLPSNYVGVVTPSCPGLWFRDYVKAGSDLIADAASRGHFAEALVLIMHGTADDTVPIERSRELTALATPKTWWQLVEASGGGHEEFFCIFDYSQPFPDDEQWGKSTLVPDIWSRISAWETAHRDQLNRRLQPLPGWKPPVNWYFPLAVVQDGVGPSGVTTNDVIQKYTVLVGASVGDGWHLSSYFTRPDGTPFVSNEDSPLYQFDKTNRLVELINRAGPTRPNAIIVKECAAYFSGADETEVGSIAVATAMVSNWVASVRSAGIIPILATVVPVNNKSGDGWQERLAGLLAYNDWVRQFAGFQRLAVLDLEAALRVSASDRSLRTDLDSGDGLHLNTRAYEDYLNPIMMPVLLSAFGEASPPPDTTPPQPVSALTARPGDGIAILQWQASSSADVAGHRVYVDGVLRTNLGNVTAYTVQDLVNGVSYLLGVTALDGATNESTRVEVPVTSIELPLGSLVTNLFQKGVSPNAAYNQCLDSIFRQVDGDTFAMEALGKAPTMDPRMTNGTGTACIWFDLSSLPDNATVSEAWLGIWFQPNDFDGSGSLVLHRLLDPDGTGMWAENNLLSEDAYDTGGASIDDNAMGSARFKRMGVPWSGTDGRYYDVINLAAARTCAHAAGAPGWITFDVTADLQAFVADSRLNLGWTFHSATDDSLRGELYLSDHSEAAKRPRLEVIYSGDTNVLPHHLPPLANAGLDQTLTDTDGNGWELVTLDGTASSAKEGTIVRYVWTLGEQLLGSTPLAQTHLSVGTNAVTLAVWDSYNASNTDTATIIVLPAPSQPTGSPLTQRTIPPLSAILAASEVLHRGDIPEDTFQPPANAIYVAPASLGGNDANAGTALSAPFEHLEKAIEYANEHPQSPLTIYLRGGVYYYKADSRHWYLGIERGNLYVTAYGTESVTIRPSYWPGNPTASGDERVFAIYGPYSNITFANLDFEGWSIIFDIGCPYETAPLRNVTLKSIRASGFTHRDGVSDFQRVFLTTAYLTNDVYGVGKVIFDHPETAHFQIENLLLSRITVEDVDLAMNVGDENDANIKGLRISGFELDNPPQQATGTSASDGLAIVNCYKVLIDDCTIQNTADDGIDCKSYDVSVFNCLVQATIRNAVKLWRNGELINSIIYDCTKINDGALVVETGGPFRIVHSAILKKSQGYAGDLVYEGTEWLTPARYQFVNSVFADLDHSFFVGTSNFVSRHCLYHNMPDRLFSGPFDVPTVAALNALTGSSNNLAAPPGLLNPAAGDFRPAFGSACIDAGTANGVLLPSFDFWGRPRIVGQTPDIGPIEYDARTVDSDGDGVADGAEAVAGTNPLDKQDLLRLDIRLAAQSPGTCLLSWKSVATRRYDLLTTTNLLLAWQPLAGQTNLLGNGTTLTVSAQPVNTPVFYQLRVRNE